MSKPWNTSQANAWTRFWFKKTLWFISVWLVIWLAGTLTFSSEHGGLRQSLRHYPLSITTGLTILALMTGLLAAAWKRYSQRSYAVFEILFGAALSFAVLSRLATRFDLAALLGFGSAIYVIGRGFHNLFEWEYRYDQEFAIEYKEAVLQHEQRLIQSRPYFE